MYDATAPGRWAELANGRRTLVAAMLGLAFGVNSLPFYTSGLFISALHREKAWSLSDLSLGPTLLVAGMALTAPAMGYLFDRYGERRFIFPGLIVQAAAFFFLSWTNSLIGFWFALITMALLGAGCSTPAYLRVVNRDFDKSKGTALALTITGAALFGAIVPPLLQSVIDAYGWRIGYRFLGIAVLCATPIIIALIGSSGSTHRGQRPPLEGGKKFSYRSLLRSQAFLPLSLTIVAVSAACAGLLIHFSPMLIKAGFTAKHAAWLIGIIGVTQIISRLATGTLIDRFFAPSVASAIMIFSATGLTVFGAAGMDWAIVGAIAVGLAYGAETDLVGYFVGRYYPAHHFGKIFGAFYALSLGVTAMSPMLYGVIFEQFGSYRPALFSAAALLLAASVSFLCLPAYADPVRSVWQPE